ncbi:MAG TPA: hypothetical protein VJU77_06650 [Chthoniobacterales bacterium]|nr:hypothetical protein [Chthoniobacterales bacterium]
MDYFVFHAENTRALYSYQEQKQGQCVNLDMGPASRAPTKVTDSESTVWP